MPSPLAAGIALCLAALLAAGAAGAPLPAPLWLPDAPVPDADALPPSVPPHQYVIACRVKRATQLLQGGTDLSLAEVAAHAGLSDQSQFTRHFEWLVCVMPGQFRTPARIV